MLDNSFEEEKKRTIKGYEESKDSLKGYFRSLYDNAGMEWTEKDDNEINLIFDSIKLMAFSEVCEFFIKMKIEKEEHLSDKKEIITKNE